MILTILFITLAAIFKAAADTMADHYSTSIWKGSDPNFYDKATSAVKAKKIFNYKLDGWHISNSLMIVAFVAAVVVNNNWLNWYWQMILYGAVFNVVFNLFYNKVLKR